MSSSNSSDEKAAPTQIQDGVEQQRTTGDGEAETLEAALGYKAELQRNRSMFTLLFQSLAIAAIPFGEGAPLLSAIYGGGQLSIFLGWICTCLSHFGHLELYVDGIYLHQAF